MAAIPTSTSSVGKFDNLLRTYATPFTATLAVVIGTSGVLMFFRLYKRELEELHEWMGIAFVLAVFLHVLRHRVSFAMLLGQLRMKVLLVLVILVSAAFLLLAPPKKGNPFQQTTSAVLHAPISTIAPVFRLNPEEAVALLKQAGASGATENKTLDEVASESNKDRVKLLMTLMKSTP